jgi:hypothetical protein
VQSGEAGNDVGRLMYGESGAEIVFDDRVLVHLQIAIGAKLRRHESFFLSWRDDSATGFGRSSIWLDSSIPLYFRYFGGRTPEVNRDWISVLMESANGPTGMQVLREPDPPGHPRPRN